MLTKLAIWQIAFCAFSIAPSVTLLASASATLRLSDVAEWARNLSTLSLMSRQLSVGDWYLGGGQPCCSEGKFNEEQHQGGNPEVLLIVAVGGYSSITNRTNSNKKSAARANILFSFVGRNPARLPTM